VKIDGEKRSSGAEVNPDDRTRKYIKATARSEAHVLLGYPFYLHNLVYSFTELVREK